MKLPLHDRRAFLVASASGLAGLRCGAHDCFAAASPSSNTASSNTAERAKSTILFFLCGGSSHIDMWDLKPHAPSEYRGDFQPIATTAPGLQISEHLPRTANMGHHLTVVRSVGATVNTNDHHGGYYYNLTGHEPDPTFLSLGNNRTPYADDWPYMGTVVASRRPPHAHLPNAITLPHKPSRAPYTRPGQFAARLGVEHDPLYVDGDPENPLVFRAPALTLEGDITADRLAARHGLMRAFDDARRAEDARRADRARDESPLTAQWSAQQHRALSMLTSSQAIEAFDVGRESESLRARYGQTVNGMSLLAARRLVQAGVPFVTVFWKENEQLKSRCKSAGGWDTHGSNFACLKDFLLPEFDQAYSALIEDLEQLDMLSETLVVVTSEMGRKPRIGDPRSGGVQGAGRDHWTHCQSVVLAGGGTQGGHAYGATDPRGEYPDDRPVTPADIAKTVYHAMGINDLEARDAQNRPYSLLADGSPLDIF